MSCMPPPTSICRTMCPWQAPSLGGPLCSPHSLVRELILKVTWVCMALQWGRGSVLGACSLVETWGHHSGIFSISPFSQSTASQVPGHLCCHAALQASEEEPDSLRYHSLGHQSQIFARRPPPHCPQDSAKDLSGGREPCFPIHNVGVTVPVSHSSCSHSPSPPSLSSLPCLFTLRSGLWFPAFLRWNIPVPKLFSMRSQCVTLRGPAL